MTSQHELVIPENLVFLHFLVFAFVRKHYISKGVRKFKQRWKNKNYFVPWGGTISCLKKTEIVSKIVGKIVGTKEEPLCCLILTLFIEQSRWKMVIYGFLVWKFRICEQELSIFFSFLLIICLKNYIFRRYMGLGISASNWMRQLIKKQ